MLRNCYCKYYSFTKKEHKGYVLFAGTFSLLLLLFSISPAKAVTQHYRLVLTETPATSMRIGWELLGGCPDTQRVYYDTIDHGQDTAAYAFQAHLTAAYFHRGMENYFCQLEGLTPDTRYYFVIAEDEGISPRFWFTTFPAKTHPWKAYWFSSDPTRSLTQKHYYQIAQRPVDFAMIEELSQLHTDEDWWQWFQGWQASIAENGQMVPIMPVGKITSDIQYLFNVSSQSPYTYALNPKSIFITIADERIPGKRFWKRQKADAFIVLHTAFVIQKIPSPVDFALMPTSSPITTALNTFTYPKELSFVEMIWEADRLQIQSPRQEKLLEIYATP